jgi:hypothetical protein
MKKKFSGRLIFSMLCVSMGISLHGQGIGLVDVRQAENIIKVGGENADIPGYSSAAIQIALDAIKTRGGGTVSLGPGLYDITGPVRIPDNTTLTGAGKTTILRKCDGFRTSFTIDADYGMLKAYVKDVSGLKKGMGIQLFDDDHNQGWDVTTAVITDIDGNVIYFDNRTVYDYIAEFGGTISNACSIIEAVGVKNVKITNLSIEGNKKTNDYINGCRGGAVYIHKSSDCLVENVAVNEFNGDSFSWQITERITVRGCEVSNGDGLGFHPGTGSDHSVVENCVSHHNKGDGIFLCWRVQNGIFRNNVSYANGENGISIGHKDTDNIFENNHVYENSYQGVFFREESEENSGHRNVFINNIIENNGTKEEASGFYIGGNTHDITIKDNTIRSAGKGKQTTAIFVGANSSRITTSGNKISGSREIVYEKK